MNKAILKLDELNSVVYSSLKDQTTSGNLKSLN